MSRIGRLPVPIPAGVKVELQGRNLTVTGKLGKQSLQLPADLRADVDGKRIALSPANDDKRARALWGTNRALVANMVTGVATGFTLNLEINGVGYRAALDGKAVNLQLGYSHDIKYPIPEGISIKVGEKQTTLAITGADKRLVGHVAAEIRALRKPEPYKGKGIKYATEQVRRKEGKKK
jgi:large subunit ribosomal protein L6